VTSKQRALRASAASPPTSNESEQEQAAKQCVRRHLLITNDVARTASASIGSATPRAAFTTRTCPSSTSASSTIADATSASCGPTANASSTNSAATTSAAFATKFIRADVDHPDKHAR
jgi:hypothetical protein